MKKILIFLLFTVFIFSAKAQTCIIHGNAGTYAGETLRLYTFSDYITETKKLAAESKVDDEGYFTFKVEGNDIFEAFIDLDVFKGYIIIEPGKDFEIVLPKKTVRRHEDIMNPYFKPYEFYIRILNDENTLTAAFKKFDALYEQALKKILKNPKHVNPGLLEKEIKAVDDSTSSIDNDFFKQYKRYKFLDLRFQGVYKNKKAIVRKNYSSEPVLYKNPAYNKLLKTNLGNILFENYADTLFRILAENRGWNTMLRYLANTDLCRNEEFREYYMFVNLYNEFYKNTVYKNNIIDILYSAKNNIKNRETLTAVENFLNNSSNLIVGNKIPDFRLPDNSSYMHSLSDFKGKFIYLGFYSAESYTCKKDILLLPSLAKKYKKDLKIILVFKENNPEKINKILKNIDTGDLLILHDDANISEEYEVRAYPSYFLINPEGRFSLIYAPGPAEGIENIYLKQYQNRKIKQIRESGR